MNTYLDLLQSGYDQVYYYVGEPLKNGSTKIYADAKVISERVQDFSKRYLHPAYLAEKAKNALVAKVLPLSNPAGWDEKMKIAVKDEKHYKALMTNCEKKLAALEAKKATPHLKKEKEQLEEQVSNFTRLYEEAIKQQEYLTETRAAQITGRFAPYVGMASNIIVPGAGIVVGTAISGLAAAHQEQCALELPDGCKYAEQERWNTRLGTYASVACATGSIALWYCGFNFFSVANAVAEVATSTFTNI